MSKNNVTLIGFVGQDTELRKLPNGQAVLGFNFATHRGCETQWTPVVVYGELAEKLEDVKKGTKLYVAGVMQTRKWVGRDKAERETTELVANNFKRM